MTETAEKLKAELARLSSQERTELAYFLLHTLDEVTDGEKLEALLLEGIEGKGTPVTADWWKRFEADVIERHGGAATSE